MDNLKKKVMVVLVMCMALVVNPMGTEHATSGNITKADIKNQNVAMLDKYSKVRRSLTHQELKTLLRLVGFKGKHLKEAWAIAIRESNGRPKAFNDNKKTGDHSYGIFQINMIGNLGEARRAKFNLKSNRELFNPVKNAQIAFYMSDGGKNWGSWHGVNSKAKEFFKIFPQ